MAALWEPKTSLQDNINCGYRGKTKTTFSSLLSYDNFRSVRKATGFGEKPTAYRIHPAFARIPSLIGGRDRRPQRCVIATAIGWPSRRTQALSRAIASAACDAISGCAAVGRKIRISATQDRAYTDRQHPYSVVRRAGCDNLEWSRLRPLPMSSALITRAVTRCALRIRGMTDSVCPRPRGRRRELYNIKGAA